MSVGSRQKATLVASMAGLLLGAITASPALAGTITVSNTNDSGAGSLRQAIAEASPGDTIILPPSAAHYAVTSAQLVIEKSLTISGAGARRSVIDAMQTAHRVLRIKTANVTISGATITGAHEATEDGGGIEIEGSSDVTLENVSVSGNAVKESEGYDTGAIETVLGTTLTIEASTIANNVAYNAGALWIGGTAVITNSTIVGNRAGSKTRNGFPSAIENQGSLTLVNDTIAGNECFDGPGCGAILGTATAKNTIIAENLAGNEHNEEVVTSNCSGAITSTGPNLENGSECEFAAHGGLSNTNPMLGPLANNGGETETEALLAGSPAIDAGTNEGCPATDQRGVPRPQGASCDIGAVERTVPSAGTPVVSAITSTGATLTASAGTVFLGGSFSYRYGPTSAYGLSTSTLPLLEGLAGEPAIATLTGLTPATTYHAQLVVSNPDGSAASGDVAFTTTAAPVAASVASPPAITAVRQTAARWREGSKLALISDENGHAKAKLPVGTTFSFSLNEPAAVTFSFTRRVAGRRVGHSCVAKTHGNRKQRTCTRTVTAGMLPFTGHSGTNKVSFQGRISRYKKLEAGRYILVVAATNTAGQKSTPRKLSFTIVK